MFGDNIEFVPDQPPAEEMEAVEDEIEDDSHLPIDQPDSWVVIESYFAAHNLVSQQIDSFNHFIEHKLPVRIRELAPSVLCPCWPYHLIEQPRLDS